TGSAITNTFTRPPNQPYTYGSTATIAEQYTKTDPRTLTVTSQVQTNDATQPYAYSTTALKRVAAPANEARTVTVYREHSSVNSASSYTKLKPGAFSARTAGVDSESSWGYDRFAYWNLNVTVTRNDAGLPSGYDGTFSYTVSSSTWDGSVDLTKYFGDNLPAGNYSVEVIASEMREYYADGNGGLYDNGSYTGTKSYNVGTRIKWTDPSYGQYKTTKFYYKSTSSSSWTARSFTSSGHTNTVTWHNPNGGNFNFRIDYLNGDSQGGVNEVAMQGVGSFSTIATSNQSLSTTFKGIATTDSASNSSVMKYYTGTLPTNITSIKAVSTNRATGVSYTAWTYPQDIVRDGFSWDGKVNLRIGSELPNGQYDIALTVNGSLLPSTIYYELGTQYEYDPTIITWPLSTQPEGAAAVFKYRTLGSTGSWAEVSPVESGSNHEANLGVLGDDSKVFDYEYVIEYKNGNNVVKSTSGTFSVAKDGTTTDSSPI
ncbi:hypothetical protein, partial [Microbulbifer rhizosphaerae]